MPGFRGFDLMEKYLRVEIDLPKIDIEGGKLQLFSRDAAQCRVNKVRTILIETHDRIVTQTFRGSRASSESHSLARRGRESTVERRT